MKLRISSILINPLLSVIHRRQPFGSPHAAAFTAHSFKKISIRLSCLNPAYQLHTRFRSACFFTLYLQCFFLRAVAKLHNHLRHRLADTACTRVQTPCRRCMISLIFRQIFWTNSSCIQQLFPLFKCQHIIHSIRNICLTGFRFFCKTRPHKNGHCFFLHLLEHSPACNHRGHCPGNMGKQLVIFSAYHTNPYGTAAASKLIIPCFPHMFLKLQCLLQCQNVCKECNFYHSGKSKRLACASQFSGSHSFSKLPHKSRCHHQICFSGRAANRPHRSKPVF